MGLAQLTDPGELAVDLHELKAHLRLTSSDEDATVELYVRAATSLVERNTGRALISRTYRLDESAFPCHGKPIELPVAPLASVEGVQYYDTAGTLQTWSSSEYHVDVTSVLGKLSPRSGYVYPSVEPARPNAVQVSFTAGYGASYENVPEGLRFVVFLLAAHFFRTRTPVNIGNIVNEIPYTLRFALDAYKVLTI